MSGDIRLVGSGSSESQGRVEICYNNQYGTVCSDSWDINDAIVACKQLGYYGKWLSYVMYFHLYILTGTSTPYSNGYFGQGTGMILLTGLGCIGSESSLTSCSISNNTFGSNICSHNQDAGVACSRS